MEQFSSAGGPSPTRLVRGLMQGLEWIRGVGEQLRMRSRGSWLDLGDWRRTVLLAGTGRSGTTWVEKVINHRNRFRVMFEPFHQKKVASISHWSYRQ